MAQRNLFQNCQASSRSDAFILRSALFAVSQQRPNRRNDDDEHVEEPAPAENNHRGRRYGGKDMHADNLHSERVSRGVYTHSV